MAEIILLGKINLMERVIYFRLNFQEVWESIRRMLRLALEGRPVYPTHFASRWQV